MVPTERGGHVLPERPERLPLMRSETISHSLLGSERAKRRLLFRTGSSVAVPQRAGASLAIAATAR